ncbi:MAG: glycosyltransferase [Flavobacteriaceae bacterium]|nr:glycosyltransferase [Flavobacteriaceae bacterium]
MKQSRILVFASYFAPNSFSEALSNNKFVLALKKKGYDVTVISTSSYVGDKYENSWSTLWKSLKENTHNIPSIDTNSKNRRLSKLIAIFTLNHPINGVSWSYKAFNLAIKLHQQNPFNFVISRSISDFGHLPALKFKKTIGLKWVANWNDPPYFIFPPPYSEKTNFIDQFFYSRYIKSVAKAADYNTFPSQRLYKYMKKELGVFKDVNSEILPHLNTNLNLDLSVVKVNHFRICHAGNLSKERSPELFLNALKSLSNNCDGEIECFIIGVENVGLKAKVKELNLDKIVKFTGAMSYQKTLEFLVTCSVGLLIEAKCDEGIFLPSKVSDYAQAKLPILAVSPKVGTMRDLLSEFGGGVISDNTDESSIYNGLETLYLAWSKNELNTFLSQNFDNYLSEDYMIKKYRDFMLNKLNFSAIAK